MGGSQFDVAAGVADVNQFLRMNGFTPRDADGNDFQAGDDASLRFKTGTSYREVAVTVWFHGQQIDALRATSRDRVVEVKRAIAQRIMTHGTHSLGERMRDG